MYLIFRVLCSAKLSFGPDLAVNFKKIVKFIKSDKIINKIDIFKERKLNFWAEIDYLGTYIVTKQGK